MSDLKIKLIINLTSASGLFNTDFDREIGGKYPKVRDRYMDWKSTGSDFGVGAVQFVQLTDELFVANIVSSKEPGIISSALIAAPIKKALKDIVAWMHGHDVTIAVPKFMENDDELSYMVKVEFSKHGVKTIPHE